MPKLPGTVSAEKFGEKYNGALPAEGTGALPPNPKLAGLKANGQGELCN